MAGTLRDQAYRYLSLEPLILCEIPPHPDFNDHANHHIGLKRFLFNVFKQAEAVDFENGWKSKEKAVDLTKPERRSKRINNKSWLARRSYVDRHEISSGDLDALLAQGQLSLHSRETITECVRPLSQGGHILEECLRCKRAHQMGPGRPDRGSGYTPFTPCISSQCSSDV
jgi:hypothetical protein